MSSNWLRREVKGAFLLFTLNAISGSQSSLSSFVAATPESGDSAIRFNPADGSYSGLTFTFDPRLDKRVELLHFEHWLSIMEHSSSLLYEALNGRAHLAEVRVLIPYKWRQFQWPVLHKPGVPIIMNRRLRFSDSDVIVGFEDPVYKETPFAIQHDECAKQGLNIHMPISFLEQEQPIEARLKARMMVREFAAHRYGIFKESGFRSDFMYPTFASLPGLSAATSNATLALRNKNKTLINQQVQLALIAENQQQQVNQTNHHPDQPQASVRGFDELWNECSFDTSPASGLPTGASTNCAPYLTKVNTVDGFKPAGSGHSFNLMSADPFSYADLSSREAQARLTNQPLPVEWRDLAGSGASESSVKWHFCGENFVPLSDSEISNRPQRAHLAHNRLATNKQNIMCNERSALEVIKLSDDFSRTPFSPPTFNRLPATNFKFLQEMPARIILCVEYAAHLYQSRRLDHKILEAAIGKFLAYDLIADTELALVLFGLQHSSRNAFKKLESSIDSRITLYNPPIDPFDEPARLYNEYELEHQLNIPATTSRSAKLVKGTCSFAKVMAEAFELHQQRNTYDDVGTDIIIITSGLFIENELKIEEILKTNFKSDVQQLNLIIYPSTMLFDTKSRDGIVVLDAIESEGIIRSRLNKLLLIQRLTNAKIHLVKEHLDANSDVKMSTLVQFYQIFDHISKGHSWDQTHSMTMLAQQAVETRPLAGHNHQANGSKLSFSFEVDASIQNELIVGFIDPKHQHLARTGKRFAIKNLQLRSPGGHLVLSDSQAPTLTQHNGHSSANLERQHASLAGAEDSLSGTIHNDVDSTGLSDQSRLLVASQTESALFPYRTQLNLAGFHLKPAHLKQLNSSHKLAGTWTLTALSDEQIQTNGIAMARVNPEGDTVTANCWIQTYHYPDYSEEDTSGGQPLQAKQGHLKAVKVFVQTKGGAHLGPVQVVNARMEIQDELGNIVQNVNMLDDGLGVPDMTRGDGIHSQYVQRTHRPGYYKVNVELSGQTSSQYEASQRTSKQARGTTLNNGQDNTCCGSFIPSSQNQPDTRYLNRQLYCGTFYVDANNRLAQQRPPRVNNLTVVNVDQDNRRVTLRWFEPQVDISAHLSSNGVNKPGPAMSENDLASLASSESASSSGEMLAEPLALSTSRSGRLSRRNLNEEEDERDVDIALDSLGAHQTQQLRSNMITAGHQQRGPLVGSSSGFAATAQAEQMQFQLSNRYEIKLFQDRDSIRRTFNSKHEVGFRFNEWNVEGTFPNASNYGGQKEVTFRIPNGREGIYYIAMKVYNNLGVGSQVSNIVQFWIRSNLTLEEAASIYGQSVTDADGNVYDKNGQLIHRAGSATDYSLSNGSNNLEGVSILMFISVLAFVFSVVCISLVACLVSSTRKSVGKRHSESHDKRVAASSAAILAAGSGSSMVSSNCGSSPQSEVASSVSGSQGGHDVENKLSLGDELTYNQLQQQQQLHQQQAQLIHNMISTPNRIVVDKQQQQQQQQSNTQSSQQWPQHTFVNGYAYATVNGLMMPHEQQQGVEPDTGADINQNRLSAMSPVQSWPADILLSHYDKVKQARERNEAPPVMRFETLENQGQFSEAGLPMIADDLSQQQAAADQSYLVRKQMPSYFNQQLQQQLSSVLKSKQTNRRQQVEDSLAQQEVSLDKRGSGPALDGVTDLHEVEPLPLSYNNNLQQQLGAEVSFPPYVYYTDANDQSGLPHSNLLPAEPSIYSQVTNLRQVSSNSTETSYYTNQWQTSSSSGAQLDGSYQADKSAISEV